MNQDEIFQKMGELQEVELIHKDKLKDPEELTYKELNSIYEYHYNFGLICCKYDGCSDCLEKYCDCFDSSCKICCQPQVRKKSDEYCKKFITKQKVCFFLTLPTLIIQYFLLKDYNRYREPDSSLDKIVSKYGAYVVLFNIFLLLVETMLTHRYKSLLTGRTIFGKVIKSTVKSYDNIYIGLGFNQVRIIFTLTLTIFLIIFFSFITLIRDKNHTIGNESKTYYGLILFASSIHIYYLHFYHFLVLMKIRKKNLMKYGIILSRVKRIYYQERNIKNGDYLKQEEFKRQKELKKRAKKGLTTDPRMYAKQAKPNSNGMSYPAEDETLDSKDDSGLL